MGKPISPFNAEGFFNIILPPICFQAGYNIRGHRVMANLVYILLYGIIGTLISMILFTKGLIILSDFFRFNIVLNLKLHHILLLASLLSNWETHSCILILDEKDYPTLTSLMFGETMINDGVVIALFNTVHSMKSNLSGDELTINICLDMLTKLLQVSFSSIFIGIGMALIVCFIMRRMRELLWDSSYVQMMLVLVAGYMSFMLSEMLECAGALTIFCAGFVLSYYAFNSMSEKGRILTKVTVHFLGFMPESFIFAYIGLSVPEFFIKDWMEFIWFGSIIVGSFYIRAIVIYLLYIIGALIRFKISISSFKSVTMLMLGGMIRGILNIKIGSIPFALSMTLLAHEGNIKDSYYRAQTLLICRTLLLTIFFTTPTLGGLVKCWAKCLGLKKEPKEK